MSFWLTFLYYVGTMLLSELLRPKPNLENAKPAGIGDFQFPTAEEGRAVPLVFGTVRVNGPNVGWFGDIQVVPIKKKVKTGLFSSKNIITGYRYFVGMQLFICRGDLTDGSPELSQGIRQIWVDDDVLRDDTEAWVSSGTIAFAQPSFFGADGGGVVGTVRILPGAANQTVSAYQSALSDVDPTLIPQYNGSCYAMFEGLEIGNAATIRPWSFEVRRIPNGLNLIGSEALINGSQANPANVIFEIMTNVEWGLGLSDIDEVQFSAAAAILATELNGYSRVLDTPTTALDLLREVEQQIDGFLIKDITTAEWQINLIRDTDYPSPLTALPVFDESNVLEFQFSRGSWADTTNQVKVQFFDPDKNFKTTFAIAQDMANKIIQNNDDVISTSVFPGVSNRSLANSLAWRELRTLSYPLSKGRIKADRSNYALQPGDLARVTWPPFGIADFFVRINKVTLGTVDANEILYEFTEDIFRTEIPSYADVPDSLWVPQNTDPVNPADARIFALPLGYQDTSASQQYGVLAARANGVQQSYSVWLAETVSQSPFNPTPPVPGDYTNHADIAPYTPTGLLEAALSINSGSPNNYDDDVIIIDGTTDISSVDLPAVITDLDGDATTTQPPNLILVDDEIMFFESMTDLTGGRYQLNAVRRGMLDTAPADHLDNARLWFLSYGIGVIEITPDAASGGLAAAFTSNSLGGNQDINDGASPITGIFRKTPIVNRFEGPSAPSDVSIDAVRLGDIDTLTEAFTVEWNLRLNSQDVRSVTQEAAHQTISPEGTISVLIYHTGQSPELLVYNQTGLAASGTSPIGGAHAVSAYRIPFSPETSPEPSPHPFPQTYRIEVQAVMNGYGSQSWTRDFTAI